MAFGPVLQINVRKQNPSMLVMKFGGAALATPEGVVRAAKRIAHQIQRGHQAIVVVSAMGDETNRLLALTRQVSPSATNLLEMDTVLCAGEQVAAGLMVLALEAHGVRARSFLGQQIPILTDGQPSDAQIIHVETRNLKAALRSNVTPVIAGFQGVDSNARLVTLGRGGSDTTAVAVAAALQVDHCEFYKDVDGIYSADPAQTESARKFQFLTYEEMESLALSGAEVLSLKAVRMAAQLKVPLHVRSAFYETIGTQIDFKKEEVCV